MVFNVVSYIGGWLGWFLGDWDELIYALVAFVTADYVAGCCCAIAEKKLSSRIGTRGIMKKVLLFLLVGIANIIDVYLIGDGNVIRTATIFFFVSNEGLSLLENACRLGLPVPPRLKEILSQLHGSQKKECGKSTDYENVKDISNITSHIVSSNNESSINNSNTNNCNTNNSSTNNKNSHQEEDKKHE